MKWFGNPWPSERFRASLCENDEDRIPVPVGSKCIHCDEVFVEGDRGEQYINGPYSHVECGLRAVLGNVAHLDGRCGHIGECNDALSHQTYREQALDVWHYFEERYKEPT